MITQANRKLGFSLLELLIATFVGAILAGGVITIMVSQLQLNASHNRNMANQQNMRDSINYMLDEISLCGCNVSEPFITTATESSFIFVGDVTGDGAWDEVNYSFDGASLQRTLRTSADQGSNWTEVSSDTLLDGLAAFSFAYFAPGNIETNIEAEISSVGIGLTLADDVASTAFTANRARSYSMTGRITLRNRQI